MPHSACIRIIPQTRRKASSYAIHRSSRRGSRLDISLYLPQAFITLRHCDSKSAMADWHRCAQSSPVRHYQGLRRHPGLEQDRAMIPNLDSVLM